MGLHPLCWALETRRDGGIRSGGEACPHQENAVCAAAAAADVLCAAAAAEAALPRVTEETPVGAAGTGEATRL